MAAPIFTQNILILDELLPSWYRELQSWSLSGRLSAAAQEALQLDGEPQALKDLVSQWSTGDFQGIPEIVLLSNTDINGALGAYAQSTGKIYLNADWFTTATQEAVNAVLTEELGHHLDGLLNTVDTSGDEGEYFSDLFFSGDLTDAQKVGLRAASDCGTIAVGGSTLAVEQAFPTLPGLPGAGVPRPPIPPTANVSLSISFVSALEGSGRDILYSIYRSLTPWGYLSLSINFTISGTAGIGVDYNMSARIGANAPILNQAFRAGINTILLPDAPIGSIDGFHLRFTPINDSAVEPTETVIVALAPGNGYSISTPDALTGSIFDYGSDTYTVTSSSSSIDEGSTLTTTISTTNVP